MINQIIFVLCIQFSYSQVQPEIEFGAVPEFSSTLSPAELFQQAIQDNVVSALAPVKPIPPLESPFANFDLPPQTPPVTPKPPRNNVLAKIPIHVCPSPASCAQCCGDRRHCFKPGK